jgi:outer membrane protein TolC
MKNLLFFILFGIQLQVSGQISLDSCIRQAYRNFEFRQQFDLYEQSASLADESESANWYPSLVLDGNFTYQNENIFIPVEFPGVESFTVPVNFNRLLVQFSQTIYDGSVTGNKRRLLQSNYSILEKQIETDRIKLKSRVISLYLAILLSQENLSILGLKRVVIEKRFEVLKAANEFGSARKADIKTLEAELLQLDQNQLEIMHNKSALISSLSIICGMPIEVDEILFSPAVEVDMMVGVDGRPEIQLLNLRIENYELQKDMFGSKRLPKINAFGSLGLGLPGYNIFNDNIRPMALVGLGLKWDIWDWGQVNKEKQILGISQQNALIEKRRIKTQFNSELIAQEQEIHKYSDLLNSDVQMVKLRSDISEIKASQLENGTITSTGYLIELNKEQESRLNEKIHSLKMLLAKLNYLTIQGNWKI